MAPAMRARSAGSPNLIGRTAELTALEDFIHRAGDQGEALVVSGAPGVGKTVLLNEACQAARSSGARVLRATAVQLEAEVGFSGLHELLFPVVDQLGGLPAAQAAALSGALGLDIRPHAGDLMVSGAALHLLRRAAQRRPVFLAVDDAQWLDRSSALVLGFIARRLGGCPIGLLATVRSEADCFLLQAGLPERELDALEEQAAAVLLDSEFPDLAPSVRERVLAVAQGNPLALRELPSGMTEAQRAATTPLPAVLPLSDELQKLFTYRLRRLPPMTRRLLLLTALDGTGDLQKLQQGSSRDEWLDGLAPAERQRLITVDTGTSRVTFRHPLLAAAVVELATSSERWRADALLRAAEPLEVAHWRAPASGRSLKTTVAAAWHLLNADGDVDAAHRLLVQALQDALRRGTAGHAVGEALQCLMAVCHYSGSDESWRPFEAALATVEDDQFPVLSVSALLYGRPVEASAAVLNQLEGLITAANQDMDPTRMVRVATAAFYVDRLAACRSSLRRIVRDRREDGAASSAMNALPMLALDAYREGRWDDAACAADDGIAWSESLGYRLTALPAVYCKALLAAARGNEVAVRSMTDELLEWGAPRGATMLDHFAARARALAALGRGDYEEAYRLYASISPPGRLLPHVPVAMWVAKDLVEAAVRSGRVDEANAHVAAMRQAEIFRLRPRLALLAAGATALVAAGEEAETRYLEALAVPGVEQFPFERARVQLAYGEHLRRTRSMSAARLQLTAALETFQRLGARPWVSHAMEELRASGLAHRSPKHAGAAVLTPQEREIAALAASGLSNKQIGSRLFLSPRTVSGHLYRVFPKLGICTRAALRDALSQASQPTPAPAPSGRTNESSGS
jgi:DNA-binding CsgD family transcriptional regulator